MAHPNTPEAIDLARNKKDWTLLQRIFGWEYIAALRQSMKDEDVFAYLEAAH